MSKCYCPDCDCKDIDMCNDKECDCCGQKEFYEHDSDYEEESE